MKVLITGGTGKIGQQLINRLVKDNLDIKVLVRKEAIFSKDIELIYGDLFDQSSLLKAVKGVKIIVHLAAITHSNQKNLYWRVNVRGTENLVKAAKKAGVNKFIFMSTRAINPKGGAYSQSKLAAEEVIKKSGIKWIILRPAEVYGITQRGMIDQLIKYVRNNYFVPLVNSNQFLLAPIYIDDLIDALEKTIKQEALINKTYILAGPENFSFKEIVDQICDFFKLKRLKIYIPVFLLKLFFKLLKVLPIEKGLAYDQLSRFLSPKSTDISLTRHDLEFKPISFKEGLSLLK